MPIKEPNGFRAKNSPVGLYCNYCHYCLWNRNFYLIQIDNESYQNVRGVAFFLVSSNAFSGIQGTLATFSLERSVFIRERFSKTYSSPIYFLGRTLCSFPFDIIYPTIGVSIVYWSTGLGQQNF